MALAQIQEIERRALVKRAAKLGHFLLHELRTIFGPEGMRIEARGLGLLAGLELRFNDGQPATEPALKAVQGMLKKGYILLPEGEDANVVSFTPPLTISKEELSQTVDVLRSLLELS